MEKLIIVKTLSQLEEMLADMATWEENAFVSFDTETTGVNKDSEIIGYSIASDVEKAYYVITRSWDVATQNILVWETEKRTKEVCKLLTKFNLIMQNAPFDCFMVNNNYGIELMPHVHTDTLILGHLLNENRSNGLKERGVELYGEDVRKEQTAMKESVHRNGGVLTKALYELYKADADLIAYYGAKDAILTLKIFYNDVPELYEQGLDKFFYDDESMPLLKGPTYEMNTTGLRIDPEKLQKLKSELEAECMEAKAFIHHEISAHVCDKYPGTGKTNHFNINAPEQLSWLLFERMGNTFRALTDAGKEMCKALGVRVPYAVSDKRAFIEFCNDNLGREWQAGGTNPKTGKRILPKKVKEPWKYMSCGKETLNLFSDRYRWVKSLLEYKKNTKLLSTYVCGIEDRMRYNVISPSFLQHGTTSGRYSCKNPNFQNLPRDDKRVKACIVSRPGKVFVGADYAQLEPRVFASQSQDETLMKSFSRGQDFYSVVGAPIFGQTGYSLVKSDPNSFAKKFPILRDKSKIISLATPYGRTAAQQANTMGISVDESAELINKYFEAYPKVELMMLNSHEEAKQNGVVYNLFGRPRRIPAAKSIVTLYGNCSHGELPYVARTLLNLAMNHKVQSTGASIVNRASIAFHERCKQRGWNDVKIVLQIHDEIVVECAEDIADEVALELKACMENTNHLPGVELIAEPKIAKNLGDLK